MAIVHRRPSASLLCVVRRSFCFLVCFQVEVQKGLKKFSTHLTKACPSPEIGDNVRVSRSIVWIFGSFCFLATTTSHTLTSTTPSLPYHLSQSQNQALARASSIERSSLIEKVSRNILENEANWAWALPLLDVPAKECRVLCVCQQYSSKAEGNERI